MSADLLNGFFIIRATGKYDVYVLIFFDELGKLAPILRRPGLVQAFENGEATGAWMK